MWQIPGDWFVPMERHRGGRVTRQEKGFKLIILTSILEWREIPGINEPGDGRSSEHPLALFIEEIAIPPNLWRSRSECPSKTHRFHTNPPQSVCEVYKHKLPSPFVEKHLLMTSIIYLRQAYSINHLGTEVRRGYSFDIIQGRLYRSGPVSEHKRTSIKYS